MPETPQPPEQSASDQSKLPYHAPRLRDLGSVSELTEGSAPGGGATDGVGYPIYAS